MIDYAKIDTSEKINKYELVAKYIGAWIVISCLVVLLALVTAP
jgi:hypothetical protein